MNSNNIAIQSNISNLRSCLDLSYAKFGKLFEDTSASAALKWESGATSPPKNKLRLLSDFCGVTVEEFSTRILTSSELKVIEAFFNYGDTITYMDSDTVKFVKNEDNKFYYSCDIYFRFNEGAITSAFDVNAYFIYDPSYPSTIKMKFEPIFNSIDKEFLINYRQLLGRYIYVSNREHFEKILFNAMYIVYRSLTSAIYQDINYIEMPVYDDSFKTYENYLEAVKDWKNRDYKDINSNLLVLGEEYKDYERFTVFWPNSFFIKNGKNSFDDYVQLKYN